MRHNFSVTVTVKGGFPVKVTGSIQPAEPDVGIMSSYIDDYTVTTLRGRPCHWLKLTRDQEALMIEKVWSEIQKQNDHDREEYIAARCW